VIAPVRIKINGKINVKGNGQECPFHASNVNVKDGASRFRGSHPFAKNPKGWDTLYRVGACRNHERWATRFSNPDKKSA
jgi:hypothetical protein